MNPKPIQYQQQQINESASKSIQNVLGFLSYVLQNFSLMRWALLLTLLIFVLEYVSISVMIPMAASIGSPSTSGSGGTGMVALVWTELVVWLGLSPVVMTWVWLFLLLLVLRMAAGLIHALLCIYVSKQVHRRFSEDVFQRVLFDVPITEVYKRSIGYYTKLAGDDTFRAGTLVNSFLLMLAGFLSAVAGFVLLYLFSTMAFIVTVAFLALSAVIVMFSTRRMLRLNRRGIDVERESATTFLETLSSLRSLRSMCCEMFAYNTYRDVTVRYTGIQMRVDWLKVCIKMIPGLIAAVAGVIVLSPWFGETINLEPAVIFAGITIILRIFVSLGSLMTATGHFVVDFRAARDLNALIQADASASIPQTNPSAEFSHKRNVKPVKPLLQLKDIHYAYDPENPILTGTDFSMHAGAAYAIVGPSGSGKSTLADLMLGMVMPDHGQILMDGCVATPESLKHRVVLVEQQPRIFSVSVRDNLTLGLSAEDADIYKILEAVDMLSVVNSLPQGIHTRLDYQGSNLSGGQRQRLAIARSLLRRPDVLILDEATSALDPKTRDLIVPRILNLLTNCAVVFITHDSEIAELADDVLKLQPRS